MRYLRSFDWFSRVVIIGIISRSACLGGFLCEDIYRTSNPERKKLIRPYDMPLEEKILEWKSIPYVGKEFAKDLPEIYTKKGERVRSKSEKLIADTLNESGIEYKYECPIELNRTE